MIPQLFCDMDGVLSDFDGYYEQCFGVRPNQDTYDPPNMWDNIRKHGSFYRNQPLMVDAIHLWTEIKQYHPNPIILSGIPWSIPRVKEQKREWVNQYFGMHVELITCFSKEKCNYADPGDIIIDDRMKYAQPWIDMGGIWVHHTSAFSTLDKLAAIYKLAQT